MAGLEFDRQAFVPTSAPQGKSAIQLASPLLLILALGVVGYVGYKVYLVNQDSVAVSSANAEIQRLQQQLGDMQRRLDAVEKHRKSSPDSAEPRSTNARTAVSAPAPSKTIYRIATGSALPVQTKPVVASRTAPTVAASNRSQEIAGEVAANREAWEATTNRLADVVGVVGTQQGEIAATREAVNELLSQTHRQAVSFELDRGNNRAKVGPVSLQFKSADFRAQHYTLCVFFNNEKCIELKNRALNEVVVFIVAKGTPPLELVTTSIAHEQIAGYLEIPASMQ